MAGDDPSGVGDPADGAGDIEPAAPDEFGLVQVWWGDGKGKTTAALGMGLRAAGHGYRVHLLQFMKGGTETLEDGRGEYAAIAALPAFSCETRGHYGWHGSLDASDDDEHAARAQGALARARAIVEGPAAADLRAPLPFGKPPEAGVHLLVLDEACYAANRGLIDPDDLLALVANKPDRLELVLTGGHRRPAYLVDVADLVSHVEAEKHPFEAGQGARKGTEY
ncbi:MAG: cob(I)yrinic acid a,c-diamide adenosyltransferase [Haloarculaceae archaeon]